MRNTHQRFLQFCHAGSIKGKKPIRRLNSVRGKMWLQAVRRSWSNHPMTWVGSALIWATVASEKGRILPFRNITQRWGSRGMLLVSASIRGRGLLSMRGEDSLQSTSFCLGITETFGHKCKVTTFHFHIRGWHIRTHSSRGRWNLMVR